MQKIIDIKNLAKYEENNRIEAKRAKGGLPNSIWETYSAFANTEGGVILLGVDEQEDHTLIATGVEDAHKMMTDLWNILNNKQKVSLNILTERMVSAHEVDDKTIISIEVPKADRHHRPIHIGNDPMRGTYRRSFEGDYLCTKDEVAAMYRDASDVSIDQKVLHTMDMTVFDMDTVHRYRNRFAQFHSTHIWNDDDDELFLRRIGGIALSEVDMAFHPTCAGLLMFGHEYDIVREYPHYFLDYQEKMSADTRWTHRMVSSSGDWSGNLYDFFFRVYPRITADMPVPFVAKGMNREDDTPLHLALREVLLNSLAHSDFYSRQGIVIIKGKDEISFANPGDIRIGLDAALAGGVSDPRNETVMKMFSLVDIGERAGTGIPDFVNIWTKYMSLSPIYSIKHAPDRTVLSIPCSSENLAKAGEMLVHSDAKRSGLVHQNDEKSGLISLKSGLTEAESGLSETAQRILELMKQNPTITYDKIAAELGKARSGIAKQIKRLIDDGIVLPKETNNGTWIVK